MHGAFVSDERKYTVSSVTSRNKGAGLHRRGAGRWHCEGDSDLVGRGGEGGEKDPCTTKAVEVVLKDRKASISYVQRKLRIGYNRSARSCWRHGKK